MFPAILPSLHPSCLQAWGHGKGWAGCRAPPPAGPAQRGRDKGAPEQPYLTLTGGCSWYGPCRAGWRWRPWWGGQTPLPVAIQVGIWVSGEHRKVGENSLGFGLAIESPVSKNLGVNLGEEGLPSSPPHCWKSLEIISQPLMGQRRRLRPEQVKGVLRLHSWVKASSGFDHLGQRFPLACLLFHPTKVSAPRNTTQLLAVGPGFLVTFVAPALSTVPGVHKYLNRNTSGRTLHH